MNDLKEDFHFALERIEGDAWEDLCRAAPGYVANRLQLAVERRTNVVISRSLVIDTPLANRVIGLGFGHSCNAGTIHALVQHFREHRLNNFGLQISPFTAAREMPQWLAEAGLVMRSHWLKMVRCDAPAPAAGNGLEVRCIDLDDATLFGDLSARGFGHPPLIGYWMSALVGLPRWRHYIVYRQSEPIASGMLYIDGAYAWLGIDSTLPECRRQGAHSALIRRRIADGLALGARFFVSETLSVNTRTHNLLRAGFRCAYMRPNYGVPAQAAAPGIAVGGPLGSVSPRLAEAATPRRAGFRC